MAQQTEPRSAMPSWTWCIVLLGLALRAYHYFRIPLVWHDEAALLINILSRNYSELLGALDFNQAAPPLFLWMERACLLWLGDSLLALRLIPFLASCASLLLMIPICKRCLSRDAIPWALFFFACSESLLWHTCEVKPYSADVLAATVLIWVWLTQREHLIRQFVIYLLIAPILMFMSYPACFLFGGVLLALFIRVIRERRLVPWLLLFALSGVVLICFGVIAWGSSQAQHTTEMTRFWARFFPNWERPWTIPLWSVIQTCELGRYCVKPYGQVLMIFALIGGILMWKRNQRELLVLLLTPLSLAFAASCLHRYPYGGLRLEVFAAPAMIILMATAIPFTLSWLRKRSRLTFLLTFFFLLTPLIPAVQKTIRPWPRADVVGAAQWVELERAPEEMVVGNGWTHQYYFRNLGNRFRPDWRGIHADSHTVVWALHTEKVSPEIRLQRLRESSPREWKITKNRHFLHTTAACLQRKDNSRVTSNLKN